MWGNCIREKPIPLSGLRELPGGHACMPTQSPHRPTEQNISQVLVGQGVTYKLGAIHMLVFFNELDDVPVFHPLGDHRKPAFSYCHPEQW